MSNRFTIWLALLFLAVSSVAAQNPGVEKKILQQIKANLKPGEPLVVSRLANDFKTPEERQSLDRLYNIFFKVPLFLIEYDQLVSGPPKLAVIAEQFALPDVESAGILLDVMEADPRVPRFLKRDPASGEITAVDRDRIRKDARFNKVLERSIAGWVGRTAPPFSAATLNGSDVNLEQLRGRVVLLYFWFTNCPPCKRIAPHLVELDAGLRGKGLSIVGINSDKDLGLGYTDQDRMEYLKKTRIEFPVVEGSREVLQAYGNVSIFPTLFLLDAQGRIIRHYVNYQPLETLRTDIEKALADRENQK